MSPQISQKSWHGVGVPGLPRVSEWTDMKGSTEFGTPLKSGDSKGTSTAASAVTASGTEVTRWSGELGRLGIVAVLKALRFAFFMCQF